MRAVQVIRAARQEDLPLIPPIERSAVQLFADFGLPLPDDGEPEPAEHWRAALGEGALWVAVDADDRPIGYVACVSHGDVLYVQQIDVRRDQQRRGLGRALMAAAIAGARDMGRSALALTTFRALAFNAPFYAQLGFVEAAHPPPWLADILADEGRRGLEDRCAMVLELAPRALDDRTRLVRAGKPAEQLARTVGPPIQKGSTVLLPNAAALYDEARPTYGRAGLATQSALAEALGELEAATAVKLFPSGLAAVAGAITALVAAGDDILVSDGAYRPTRRFCDRVLARFGVGVRYYAPRMAPQALMALATPATRLIVLESPASLTFEMQDVAAIARLARAQNVLTLMDNTWGAGLLFKPLAHGVDVSVQALTKYVGGHSDAFMGSAAVASPELEAALDRAVWDFGWAVAAEDAYQMLRGLRTLPTRLERHGASGLKLAAWLADQPEVLQVLHPALPGAHDHALWRRDYRGAAGLFAVVLKPASERAVEALLDALTLFGLGFSWGGFESLAVHCDPQLDERRFPPNLPGPLVRLSIGLEAPDDLIADLRQALDVFAKAGADG